MLCWSPYHKEKRMSKNNEIRDIWPMLAVSLPACVDAILSNFLLTITTALMRPIGNSGLFIVGISNQLKMIYQVPVIAFNMGLSIIAARRYGERNFKGVNICVWEAVFLNVISSVVIAIVAWLFRRPALTIFGTSEEYFHDAEVYYGYLVISLLIQAFTLTISASFSAIGKTVFTMLSSMVSILSFWGIGWILINGCQIVSAMGIEGAGIALVISCMLTMVFQLFLIRIYKLKCFIPYKWQEYMQDRQTLFKLLTLGKNTIFARMCNRLGYALLTVIITSFGTNVYSAYMVYMSILEVSNSMGSGFSVAATALTGQKLGLRDEVLAKKQCKFLIRCLIIFTLFFDLLLMVQQAAIIGLFTSDVSIIGLRRTVIPVIICITVIENVAQIYSGALNGAGAVRYIAVVSFFSLLLFMPAITYLMASLMENLVLAIFIATFLHQGLMFLLYGYKFYRGSWITIKI